jgi:hypothetical protein
LRTRLRPRCFSYTDGPAVYLQEQRLVARSGEQTEVDEHADAADPDDCRAASV